jgi:hypothetical protein
VPRVDRASVRARVSGAPDPRRRIWTSPSKSFGSGRISVASLPFTSSRIRGRAESNEKIAWADAPPSNRMSAPTWLGTVTSKVWPASGPDPIDRRSRAVDATAATELTGPKVWMNAVR